MAIAPGRADRQAENHQPHRSPWLHRAGIENRSCRSTRFQVRNFDAGSAGKAVFQSTMKGESTIAESRAELHKLAEFKDILAFDQRIRGWLPALPKDGRSPAVHLRPARWGPGPQNLSPCAGLPHLPRFCSYL